MNVLFGGGGYPWTVIRLSRRQQYLEALEAASTGQDTGPLTTFILEEMSAGVREG